MNAKSKILKIKWRNFVTRPSILLERDMRLQGYRLAGLSHILDISDSGLSKVFVNSKEWRKSEKKYEELFYANKLMRLFRGYVKELVRESELLKIPITKKSVGMKEFARRVFISQQRLTRTIIVTHFLELNTLDKALISETTKLGIRDPKIFAMLATSRERVKSLEKIFPPRKIDLRKLKLIFRRSPRLKRISDIASKSSFLHETARRAADLMYEKLKKLIPKEFEWYLTEEVLKGLNGQEVHSRQIKQRRNGFVLYINDKKKYVFTGQIAQDLVNKIIRKAEAKKIDKIQGTIASPGIVKGHARVVHHILKMRSLKKGEILVCPMTEPRIVYLLGNAAAIVTDEGGLTSHAAVVSRELNIPCIIGTKIATKVLKDGDLVEVDADKGVVRVIKKVGR